MTKNAVQIRASISVRIGTSTTRIQLIPYHDNPKLFRPRVNRRYLGTEYLTGEQVAKLVQGIAFGDDAHEKTPQDFRRYTRCAVRKIEDGDEYWTQFQVLSPPVRCYDGEWRVFGNAIGWGRDFYHVGDIKVRVV